MIGAILLDGSNFVSYQPCYPVLSNCKAPRLAFDGAAFAILSENFPVIGLALFQASHGSGKRCGVSERAAETISEYDCSDY